MHTHVHMHMFMHMCMCMCMPSAGIDPVLVSPGTLAAEP